MDQDESMGTILRWEAGSVILGALYHSSQTRICCQTRGFSLLLVIGDTHKGLQLDS